MKLLLALVFIVMGSTARASAQCPMDFEQVNLCASLDWIDGPYLNKKSHLAVTFWEKGDETQTAISPNIDVHIYSWMVMASGHSHGGPTITSSETSEGVFESTDARFFMGGMNGYWLIRVDLKNADSLISGSETKVVF